MGYAHVEMMMKDSWRGATVLPVISLISSPLFRPIMSLHHGEITHQVIGAFYHIYNEVGLLFNFGPQPEMRRMIWMRDRRELSSSTR